MKGRTTDWSGTIPLVVAHAKRERARMVLRGAFPRRKGRLVFARNVDEVREALRTSLVDAVVVDIAGSQEETWKATSLAGDHPTTAFFGITPLRVGDAGAVNGFGFLHAWHPSECFRRTAEITYFLHPGATRQGIGSLLLDRILVEAKAMEIDSVLASISSRNSESLAFHRRHGFQECGCFPRIGRKHGEDFGVIWLLRQL